MAGNLRRLCLLAVLVAMPLAPSRGLAFRVSPAAPAAADRPVVPGAAYAGQVPRTWAAARAAILAAAPHRRPELARGWAEALAKQHTPLREGGTTYFFFHGAAAGVAVTGDFTRWTPRPLERLSGTDLWVGALELPEDAVLGYRLLVDGRGRTDPLNHRTSVALGNDWSVYLGARAPGREPPAGPAPGRVRLLTLDSPTLGRPVAVTVHVPPACTAARRCGALYVADGPFYLGEGNLAATVAAAPALPPLVLVGVAPPANPILRTVELLPGIRGDAWTRFLADELLPAVEAQFPVVPDQAHRGVLGLSAGAGAMLQAVLGRPDLFSRAVIQSPVALGSGLERAAAAYAGPPLRLWLTWGAFERDLFGFDITTAAARLYGALAGGPARLAGGEQPAGHTMAAWRRDLPEALGWAWATEPRAGAGPARPQAGVGSN